MVVHGPYPVGEPRVAREQAVARANGLEVDVVAMRRAGEPLFEVVDGANVFRLPLTHQRGLGIHRMVMEYAGFTALAAVVVACLSIRRRYAVVHVHNPPDFLIVVALIPKLLGAKVFFDVHDLSSDMFEMRFANRAGARSADWILRAVERWAPRLADSVITVHEPYRRELVARGVAADKITVVMNSVDERLMPNQRLFPNSRPRRPGFVAAYHGTVTPHYGVHLLVEAVAELVDEIPLLELWILGEGDALDEVESRASALGIRNQVTFSGCYLSHREVLRKIQSASVGVIPNLPTTRLNRYALSSKLFEYVVLDIPVVAADLPTIREHFSPDEVLFFEPGVVSSLTDALLQTARNPGSASSRAAAARARYEKSYHWSLSAQRYARLLRGAA